VSWIWLAFLVPVCEQQKRNVSGKSGWEKGHVRLGGKMDCTSTRHQSKTIENYKITKASKGERESIGRNLFMPPRICVLLYAVFLFLVVVSAVRVTYCQ